MTAAAHAAATAAHAAAATSAAGIVTKQIDDADGNGHDYLISLHRVDDGLDVVGALVALGGEPLGQLLQGVAGDLIAEGGISLDGDAGELLKSIDWSAVGRDAASAVQRIRLSSLAAELLKYTHRDGQPLATPAARDAAYRGNYGELYRALLAVIQANRFLPF